MVNKIRCTINFDYCIRLVNVTKVQGHDDSLPYVADFEVAVRDEDFKKIGRLYNDGWGGCTQFLDFDDEGKHILSEIETHLNTITWGAGDMTLPLTLELLCDIMAEEKLHCNLSIYSIPYFLSVMSNIQ